MNAKEEFLQHIGDKKPKCVFLSYGYRSFSYGFDTDEAVEYGFPVFCLKENHTNDEYLAFLKSINFEYDDGFGGQELFGNIWYDDGTWSDRAEYDGSEWWVHRFCPEIKDLCK